MVQSAHGAGARCSINKDNDDMTAIDPRQFRSALGAFATGVTIVTTTDEDEPVGVTASSFNSVSLDPPLVLWSLGKTAKSLNAFRESGHFAVHVLSCHQQKLSNAFAKSGEDKFAGVKWAPGALGSPILDEFAAKFECRTVHQYEGGDHIILVGEVISFEQKDVPPLVFHGGQYAETRPSGSGEYQSGVEPTKARFTEDFLLYLLALAHFQTNAPARRKLAELSISQQGYYALTALALGTHVTKQDLAKRLEHTGIPPTAADMKSLSERGFIEDEDGGYKICEAGRDVVMEILSLSKATEETLLLHFTPTEIAEFKHYLKKLVSLTGEPAPNLWGEQG